MRNINKESIINPERYLSEKKMTKGMLEKALKDALIKIDKLWDDVHGNFATHTSEDGIYGEEGNPPEGGGGWNQGFWTGIQWLAYEATGDQKYCDRALSHIPSFYERIDKKLGVNHHDMGFLYVPSCVAAYKLKGNELAKEAAIKAADHLLTRYIEPGGYIQAWGNVGEQKRLIIDCMNNIPLLYWAAEVTGNQDYYDKALHHAKVTLQNIIREDGSTFHTFYFHDDGTPDKGVTAQGASDGSCWARGQAWMVSGLPQTYKYVKEDSMVDLFEKVANHYINRLPKDFVPYWDMTFNDGDDEERDSSAASIAVCGFLEMIPYIKDEQLKAVYEGVVDKIMYSLYENYSTKDTPESNGLLLHAVYSRPGNYGVDECNIWGCYYYMEALVRMLNGTKAYW